MQTETQLDIFTALTEGLEQSPPCDVGRIGDPPPGIEPCEHPADVSCRLHQCGMPEGVLVLLCEGHLNGIVGRVSKYLALYGGFYEENCGHAVRSVEDFIWAIAPLR